MNPALTELHAEHCPLHRHLLRPRHKSTPTTPPARTQPYAAPYFFPAPDSPEAADYVRSLQAERRRSARLSANYDSGRAPSTSPKNSPKPSPQASPRFTPSALPPAEEVLSSGGSRENLMPRSGERSPQRRRSWLSVGSSSRPGTPNVSGDEQQEKSPAAVKSRRSWRRHARHASAEDASTSRELTPSAATPTRRKFFRRSLKA